MDQPGEVVANPTRGQLNRKSIVSLSQFAVPSLQGRHGFSLLCTMFAKNMSTVFTEPSLGASSVSIERKDGSRLHHMLFCCQGAFFLRAIDYSTTVLQLTAHSSWVRSGQVIDSVSKKKVSSTSIPVINLAAVAKSLIRER